MVPISYHCRQRCTPQKPSASQDEHRTLLVPTFRQRLTRVLWQQQQFYVPPLSLLRQEMLRSLCHCSHPAAKTAQLLPSSRRGCRSLSPVGCFISIRPEHGCQIPLIVSLALFLSPLVSNRKKQLFPPEEKGDCGLPTTGVPLKSHRSPPARMQLDAGFGWKKLLGSFFLCMLTCQFFWYWKLGRTQLSKWPSKLCLQDPEALGKGRAGS